MEKSNNFFPSNKYNRYAWILGSPHIGDNVWIGAFTLLDAKHADLFIGNGCNIASGVQLLTHSSVHRTISERQYGKIDADATVIEDFCFVGTNAVILKGAKIGHHSVVAAGAVVLEGTRVPPFSLIAGVPAKVIGSTRKYKEMNESISIVLPGYNEQETVEAIVIEAIGEVRKLTKSYQIVLINDGSTDATGRIMRKLEKKYPSITLVEHKKNKGFSGAIKAGYRHATKDLILLAPMDGQFSFKELHSFREGIRGYDVAVGYRVKNPEPFIRKVNSRIYHLLARFLFDVHLREISTVIMWRKHVLEAFDLRSNDRSVMLELELVGKALRAGFKFSEVPFHFLKRRAGKSKAGDPKMMLVTLYEMFRLKLSREI